MWWRIERDGRPRRAHRGAAVGFPHEPHVEQVVERRGDERRQVRNERARNAARKSRQIVACGPSRASELAVLNADLDQIAGQRIARLRFAWN
jgi:hypothetical protein